MPPFEKNKADNQLEVWNPNRRFQTKKKTSNVDEPNPHFEWQEELDRFIELGSKIIITTSTAWWAICELVEFVRTKSIDHATIIERLSEQQRARDDDDEDTIITVNDPEQVGDKNDEQF